MQKLVLNVPLRRKADPYHTTEVVVEKVIRLPAHEFDLLREHPMQDNPLVKSNIPYMWMDSQQAHCVLFLDTDSGDGILVDSEGSQYARYSQYIPNARDMVNAHELSGAEWNLHDAVLEIAKKISLLAHRGESTVDMDTMLSEIGCDPTELLTTAVIVALQDREDIRWATHKTDTMIHVEAKPKEQLTLYCPVAFQVDEPKPRAITPENACLAQSELQIYLSEHMKSYGDERGYMEAHIERDALCEKVVSAMPRFEIINGGLMLAVVCQIAEPLTDLEMNELKEEIRWQLEDHAENVQDEAAIQTPLGAMRVFFWSDSPEWSIQTADELEAANAPDESEALSEPTM